jgi:hypothetical protein
MECDGHGYCLSMCQLVCVHECRLQECPNFKLCESEEPQFILDFNRGVCNSCTAHFGPYILDIDEDRILECPVCLSNTSHSIGLPRCTHRLCTECFRAIYFDDTSPFPLFPYPELEEEYFADPELFLHDEKVRAWRADVGSWKLRRLTFLAQQQPYLKHCPLCRK